jgi:geranylgeranyl diphosphate synthase type I
VSGEVEEAWHDDEPIAADTSSPMVLRRRAPILVGDVMDASTAATVPAGLSNIGARVDARMSELLDAEIRRWADVDADLVAPLTSLRQLVLAGGKRLRPAFCHWAFVGAGGDPSDERVVAAGAALELLHTFALIHDDVMDGSSRRRGLDTIHMTFESRHTLEEWRGEGRRFGEGVAILVGDLAFVYADMLMAGASASTLDVFNELRLEVNIGQYLDLLGTARNEHDPAVTRRISQYKSGKYTVERPLHLGAALAGRFPELEPALTAYGMPLGEAFQLRDDLLGAFGDSSVTGKPVGEDLREGKPTPLYAAARARADGAAAALLTTRFGFADLTDDEIADIQTVFVDTGACAEIEASIERLCEQAVSAIERAPVTPEAVTHLVDLAHFVAGRDH